MKKVTPKADLVLVVRYSNDATKDFWLPRDTAKRLFDAGELWQTQVDGSHLDYFSAGKAKGELKA